MDETRAPSSSESWDATQSGVKVGSPPPRLSAQHQESEIASLDLEVHTTRMANSQWI